jgi:hypothetical protein
MTRKLQRHFLPVMLVICSKKWSAYPTLGMQKHTKERSIKVKQFDHQENTDVKTSL